VPPRSVDLEILSSEFLGREIVTGWSITWAWRKGNNKLHHVSESCGGPGQAKTWAHNFTSIVFAAANSADIPQNE
jgi:hypothetical protein